MYDPAKVDTWGRFYAGKPVERTAPACRHSAIHACAPADCDVNARLFVIKKVTHNPVGRSTGHLCNSGTTTLFAYFDQQNEPWSSAPLKS